MAKRGRRTELGHSLAQALINLSTLPLLLLDGDLRVVSASRSFCTMFDMPTDQVEGVALAALGHGEWEIAELSVLLDVALAGGSELGPYETDLIRGDAAPRRLLVNVQNVANDPSEAVRVLVSIDDVTEVRRADRQIVALLFEKDDLLRERDILLQEMQHRVANSLQIIASVLMLKARTVKSEESREHLRDAHDRVMSLAAVQHLLQATLGDVEVGGYLTELCNSLGSSMIRESRPLTLEVNAGPATVSSREAVSLGLIVTELVINALKHAFPDERSGRIEVDYNFHGPNWVLCVRDNGVGMPTVAPARTGMGASIVQALARQLGAVVEISSRHPGTQVSIQHTRVALVHEDPRTARDDDAGAQRAEERS